MDPANLSPRESDVGSLARRHGLDRCFAYPDWTVWDIAMDCDVSHACSACGCFCQDHTDMVHVCLPGCGCRTCGCLRPSSEAESTLEASREKGL